MTAMLVHPVTFAALLATAPVAVPLALVAGTHAATWGAYKDAPYEGYHPWRQVRTLVVALGAAVVAVMTGLVDAHAAVPAVGVVYALERLATEWWKSIVREDDQSAYTIPMRLGFRGLPVDRDWARYGIGALVLVAMGAIAMGVHVGQVTMTDAFGGVPGWLLVATVGGLGGWATAVGGAWKDAPVEGFSFWKFLRSPAVATAWAVPLSWMTGDWVTLSLAAGGLAVFSIETYKTFWTAGRPPGKFAEQAVRDSVPRLRRVMGVLHTGAWVLFAVAGLREAWGGFAPDVRVADLGTVVTAGSTTWIRMLDQLAHQPHLLGGVTSAMTVAAAALLAAGLVLRANVQLTGPLRATARESPSGGQGTTRARPPGGEVVR